MSLYQARPDKGVAWVTGASTGIGRALSLQLAGAGYTVAATARSADKLETLSAQSAALKGRIIAFACDVTDAAAMTDLVQSIEASAGPVALAVFNAGNYEPAKADRLDGAAFRATYEVNLFGVLNGLIPVSRVMHRRGGGQIMLVGSVSGYGGLPLASAYGASKAALINMAESLKFDFDRMNIRLQIANPGFVDTPLTGKNEFAMPALMGVEAAAGRMMAGLQSGAFEITFPRRFTWALKAVNLLPYRLYFAVIGWMTGWSAKGPKPFSEQADSAE